MPLVAASGRGGAQTEETERPGGQCLLGVVGESGDRPQPVQASGRESAEGPWKGPSERVKAP